MKYEDYPYLVLIFGFVFIIVIVLIVYFVFSTETQIIGLTNGILLRNSWVEFLVALGEGGPALAGIMGSINKVKEGVFSPGVIASTEKLQTDLGFILKYSETSTAPVYALAINSVQKEFSSLFASEPVLNQALINASQNFYNVAYSLQLINPILPFDKIGQALFDFIFDFGEIITRVLQFPNLGPQYPTLSSVFKKLLAPRVITTLNKILADIPAILTALGVLDSIEIAYLKTVIDGDDIPPMESLANSELSLVKVFYQVMDIILPP